MVYLLSVVKTNISCPCLILMTVKNPNGAGNDEPLIMYFLKGVQGPPGIRGIQGLEVSVNITFVLHR